MFWLTAIVRPFKPEDVYEQLLEDGVKGMTVSEVKGVGNQKGNEEIYRGKSHKSSFVSKIKIEMAVPEDDLSRITQKITDICKTGKTGDGKIFITKLEQTMRIRTGEIDLQAI